MKKEEYISKISSNLHLTKKDVTAVVDAFINELIQSLIEKESVSITNFGTFKKEYIQAKNMFSPYDGSNIKNDYYRIHFSMSNYLSKKLKSEKTVSKDDSIKNKKVIKR